MASIAEAEARIGELQRTIEKQREIVDAANRVLPVLLEWQGQFKPLIEGSSTATSVPKDAGDSIAVGQVEMENGCFNMGGIEGSSRTFEATNDSLRDGLGTATTDYASKAATYNQDNEKDIEKVISEKEKAENMIKSCEGEISNLKAWIEEERRKEEEERKRQEEADGEAAERYQKELAMLN